MKEVIGLCVLILLLEELTHSHQIDPKDVFVESEANTRLRKGSTNISHCYETFIPKISEFGERVKNQSETVIMNADVIRQEELHKVWWQRLQLEEKIDTVRHSLSTCTAEQDSIKYVNCLRHGAAGNREAANAIEYMSSSLHGNLTHNFNDINKLKDLFIGGFIEMAKIDIGKNLNALRECLLYRQPQPDAELFP